MNDVSNLSRSNCRAAIGQRPGNAGFVLIEALVAMAIGALLLVTLGSLLALVTRASQSISHSDKAVEETTAIYNALVREISTVSPLRWAGNGAGFVFEGHQDRLVFASDVSRGDGMTDTRLTTLDSQAIGLRQHDQALSTEATGRGAVGAPDTFSNLDNDFIVRFAYFGSMQDGRETLTDTWSDPDTLPIAVRVTLTERNGATRGVVRIPILVSAEPGCAAPGLAACSFVPVNASNAAQGEDVLSAPVDADDAQGWGRYLGQ